MIQLEVLSPSYNNKLSVGSSVPIGQSGLVHIWGYNDANVPRHMGIHWIVKDPDGVVVEDYEDWVSVFGIKIELDPDDDHEFIGGRFDLDKVGTYTIAVNLLMNLDSPVVVDSYEGALCTTTTEVPPEYELIQHTIFPYAYVYDGKSELTIATFRTDPFSPATWQAEKLADKLKEELEKDGRRVLMLNVYADTTPLLWKDLRFEIETTLPPTTAGMVVGIEPVTLWLILGIILAAIGLVIAIAIMIVGPVLRTFKHEPIDDDIKKGMSKEWLILTIGEFEARLINEGKLPGPPTPPEVLQEESDGELRDYCDMLAEEIAPPGVDWMPWAIGAGVVVLGAGAVAVLAARKKK